MSNSNTNQRPNFNNIKLRIDDWIYWKLELDIGFLVSIEA